jgi:hypothetical protein
MLRFFVTLALLATLSQCDRPVEGQTWRASDDNGDKPGLGYELRNDNGKVSGDAYIIDPGFPHDFSHGRRAAMTLVKQSPGEITFRVEWDRDLKATLRFQFNAAGWPDSFQAVVAEIIGSESYDAETFTFAKVK